MGRKYYFKKSGPKWRERLPPWRVVERDFRVGRDKRMKITLPRVKCLESEWQESEGSAPSGR